MNKLHGHPAHLYHILQEIVGVSTATIALCILCICMCRRAPTSTDGEPHIAREESNMISPEATAFLQDLTRRNVSALPHSNIAALPDSTMLSELPQIPPLLPMPRQPPPPPPQPPPPPSTPRLSTHLEPYRYNYAPSVPIANTNHAAPIQAETSFQDELRQAMQDRRLKIENGCE